jgi:prepilin-type N-terminal cleavage/methylation domain-containing protein
MKYRPHIRSAGFSLVEILVALTILAVGIIAVMRLFPVSFQQAHLAAERTTVASVARTELGRVRAGGVYNQDNFQPWLAEWARQNALRSLSETNRAYSMYDSWRTSVQRVGGGETGDDLYRVTFSVRLIDGREEKFVTYVTEL